MRWFTRWMQCPTCKGNKTVKDENDQDITCPDCKGRGKVIRPSFMLRAAGGTGRRAEFKPPCPRGFEGSIPSRPTKAQGVSPPPHSEVAALGGENHALIAGSFNRQDARL